MRSPSSTRRSISSHHGRACWVAEGMVLSSVVPDAGGCEGCAFGKGGEFGPAEFWVDAGAEPAVGARDDVLGAEQVGVAGDALGDQFRVLDQVRGVCDDTGDKDFAVRQFDVLPHVILVLVP